jgi:hypothetical protein
MMPMHQHVNLTSSEHQLDCLYKSRVTDSSLLRAISIDSRLSVVVCVLGANN